jgi:hypothetical protein
MKLVSENCKIWFNQKCYSLKLQAHTESHEMIIAQLLQYESEPSVRMTNFLDIINRLSLIKKMHDVSETGVCLRHQVEKGTPTLLGPIKRASPYLQTTINQPIKKLTKGGVIHKCRTSSLARLNHSCIQNGGKWKWKL